MKSTQQSVSWVTYSKKNQIEHLGLQSSVSMNNYPPRWYKSLAGESNLMARRSSPEEFSGSFLGNGGRCDVSKRKQYSFQKPNILRDTHPPRLEDTSSSVKLDYTQAHKDLVFDLLR